MTWKNIWNRLKGLPTHHETALDEELTFHLAMKQREFEASGMTAKDANTAARRAIGNLTLAREDSRAAWSFPWLADLGRDLRYAVRTLAAQPGFTCAAVLALVLGIGVNAIVFNVYNALALAPWAIRDAAHTVRILEQHGSSWVGLSWPEYRYFRDHTQTFSGLAAFDRVELRATRGGASWTAGAVAASENYFGLLGTGFAAGRGFSPSSGNLQDPAPEIVLHYDEWMSRFGGDKNVIGEWIELNGHKLQIVGVATQGFSGPYPVAPQLWIPAPWRGILHPGLKSIDNPNFCCTSVVGTLPEAVSRERAQAELTTLSAQFYASIKQDPTRILLASPAVLADPGTSRVATPMFLAIGVASLLILLLACANVANLQLARAVARQREFAVRASLGAGLGRILRQLLVEGLLLSGIAGAITFQISAWLPGWIVRTISGDRLGFSFSNDWRVTCFVLLLTLTATLLFGLAPAVGAARRGVSGGLQEGGRSTTTNRMRNILMAAQVALCAILLSGASLLVRALETANHISPGFQYEQVVLMLPGLDSTGIAEDKMPDAIRLLMERMAALPQVERVAHATVIPLGKRHEFATITDRAGQVVSVGLNKVSAGFFDTIGVPMVAGRMFTSADEGRQTIIVNRAFAERFWPGENPLGKTLNFTGDAQVVGVVRDFYMGEIGPDREISAFIPSKGSVDSRFLIRHTGAAGPLVAALPRVAVQADRRIVATAEAFEETIGRARRVAQVVATVASILSVLALVLACVGIYGVAAYNVSQRTREIGLRIALGAKPVTILQMILQQSLRVVAVGGAFGLAGALVFAKLLASLLAGVKPSDPIALLATIAILLFTAGAAALAPARRAAAVDPAVTLRHD